MSHSKHAAMSLQTLLVTSSVRVCCRKHGWNCPDFSSNICFLSTHTWLKVSYNLVKRNTFCHQKHEWKFPQPLVTKMQFLSQKIWLPVVSPLQMLKRSLVSLCTWNLIIVLMTHTNVNICMLAETLTANILSWVAAWTPLNTVCELEQQQGRLILQ